MSDPSLVQITFKIKPEMPYDMKKLILALFTDYFNYYPEKADDESASFKPIYRHRKWKEDFGYKPAQKALKEIGEI